MVRRHTNPFDGLKQLNETDDANVRMRSKAHKSVRRIETLKTWNRRKASARSKAHKSVRRIETRDYDQLYGYRDAVRRHTNPFDGLKHRRGQEPRAFGLRSKAHKSVRRIETRR